MVLSIVFQPSVVDNHPIVLKFGDKDFCVNVDTQLASSPVLVLLIVRHFVCIRHGVMHMTRSLERRERTTSPTVVCPPSIQEYEVAIYQVIESRVVCWSRLPLGAGGYTGPQLQRLGLETHVLHSLAHSNRGWSSEPLEPDDTSSSRQT